MVPLSSKQTAPKGLFVKTEWLSTEWFCGLNNSKALNESASECDMLFDKGSEWTIWMMQIIILTLIVIYYIIRYDCLTRQHAKEGVLE